MNRSLPEEATEFAAAARAAFAGLGGADAARRAEIDPDHRAGEVARVLAGLGVPGLDPREDETSRAAAAELCREAGRVALPYPLPAVLAGRDRPLAVVASGGDSWRADHADLFADWEVADLAGGSGRAQPGRSLQTRLGPFVGDLSGTWSHSGDPTSASASASASTSASGAGLQLVLSAWMILGGLEAAVDSAVAHVSGRVQFGQTLSEFQAVQFQLADASVAVEGLREAARFALWRWAHHPDAAVTDALALRLQALDSARAVLRTAQQLHGASGLCDEYDISIHVRHLQPALRLPFGAETNAEMLFDSVEDHGFASLFPHGGRP